MPKYDTKKKIMAALECPINEVFYGYSLVTHETGWHYQAFGESSHWFLGTNLESALAEIAGEND